MSDGRSAPRNTNNSPIARIRKELGLTQRQLADLVGTHPNNISRWEIGSVRPYGENLAKLAAALKCSMDDLIQK